MGAKRNTGIAVERPDQLRVLRSPLRQEIVDLLVGGGPRSVAELAETLGRPADGLYYHVRRLQRVGLLVSLSRSRAGRRTGEVVDVAARPVALAERAHVASHRAAVGRIVASMLRLTERQYAEALRRRGRARHRGPREEWAARVTGWLTAAERDELMRALARLNAAVQSRSRDGRRRLHAFTFVVAPIDARARRRTARQGRRP